MRAEVPDSIRFANVSKRYRIGRAVPSLRNLFRRRRNEVMPEHHWALRGVSFNLRPGESLGIIGPNGAGKTTILKLLSRVTYPTEGDIVLNGRFSSLIELGAGFHPDLTGRENIFPNGTILGMRRGEINERFDDIVDFAGIGNYLDTPVKRYSSGMYARLGFAVAAHVDPEILLVDEVLAVGDMAFRQKCYERMRKLMGEGTTLVFVSHDFGAVQKVCERTLVMYRGQLAYSGDSANAVAEYSNILRKAASRDNGRSSVVSGGLSQMVMSHGAVIEEVKIMDSEGRSTLSLHAGEPFTIRVRIRFNEDAPAPVFACTVRSPDGEIVYDYTTRWCNHPTPDFPANSVAEIEFRLENHLVDGTYHLGTDLAYADLSRYYDRMNRALDFTVTGGSGARGYTDLGASLSVLKVASLAGA